MSNRRKRYLVQRFQYKIICRLVLYCFLYQFTLWNAIFCWHLLQHGQGHLWLDFKQFAWEFWPMLACFAILVPILAWDSVRFYHGIAGPLVQFRRALTDIAAHQPVRRIKLRDTDQLVELEEDFNRMLETLQREDAVTIAGEESNEKDELTHEIAESDHPTSNATVQIRAAGE
jgi:hypothetical protein